MAFFKKLKKDIGIEDQTKAKEEEVKEKILKSVQEKKNIKESEEEKVKVSVEKEEKEANASSDWFKKEGQLAVDVFQTETEFCVQAPIAGVEPSDLEVVIENGMLIIKGERKEPKREEKKEYFYRECYWGPFSREIILPEDLDIQKVKAALKKGVLKVQIPKSVPKIKKKKIPVISED